MRKVLVPGESPSETESLLLSALDESLDDSQRFELCRFRFQARPDVYMLDAVLANRRTKIDLRLVRLMVNALRYRKGSMRHDYLLRLLNGPCCLSSAYMTLNADVVDYLVKCSLKYRASSLPKSAFERNTEISIPELLLGMVGGGRQREGRQREGRDVEIPVIGECLARLLRLNGMDPSLEMPPLFRQVRGKNGLQISVALHMGWVERNWSLVVVMLEGFAFGLRADMVAALIGFIRSLDFSELSYPMALRIMRLVLDSDLDSCFLDVLSSGLAERLDAGLSDVLLDFIAEQKYHGPLMTRFALRRHGTPHPLPPLTLAIRADSKIAAAVYHHLRAKHPHDFTHPKNVSRMLSHGSQTLVYAAVWDSEATLSQLVSGLFVSALGEGRLPGRRLSWVKEMHGLRVLLRRRGHGSFVKFGDSPFFPYRAANTVLQFGWLGETSSWDFRNA